MRLILLGVVLLCLVGCTTLPSNIPADGVSDEAFFCTKEYRPVCGDDGVTYSNPCLAEASGVTIVREGSCDPQDGGIIVVPEEVILEEPAEVFVEDATHLVFTADGKDFQELEIPFNQSVTIQIVNPNQGVVRVKVPAVNWIVTVNGSSSLDVELPILKYRGIYSMTVNDIRAANLRVI